jgi:molecular chaperone Hsp33
MHDRDCLHRFLFEQFPFRGHLVHLDAAWRALIEHREYPAAIRDTLGEAVAASLLLAATIKFDGVLSLQLQGDGPVHLLLAQCTSGLGVRGLARYREGDAGTDAGGGTELRAETETGAGAEVGARAQARVTHEFGTRIGDLIGAGNLTVTLETDEGSQRYQGIVPVTGERLADSLQVYFENSEQLPTRLWLYADEHGASGMLLQRLPGLSVQAGEGALAGADPLDAAAIDDAWHRVQLMGQTLTAEEMRSLSDADILHRLFNEDDVRLFEPSPVYFRCRCSRERVSGMLQGLGETETRSVLAERGEVEVRCDFCNRAYVFDAVDVAQLFNQGLATGSGSSVH